MTAKTQLIYENDGFTFVLSMEEPKAKAIVIKDGVEVAGAYLTVGNLFDIQKSLDIWLHNYSVEHKNDKIEKAEYEERRPWILNK